jgi:hypothetical protein
MRHRIKKSVSQIERLFRVFHVISFYRELSVSHLPSRASDRAGGVLNLLQNALCRRLHMARDFSDHSCVIETVIFHPYPNIFWLGFVRGCQPLIGIGSLTKRVRQRLA